MFIMIDSYGRQNVHDVYDHAHVYPGQCPLMDISWVPVIDIKGQAAPAQESP
jgi:hypothetical protein